MASGWRQDSVRMASGWRQDGVRMASGWRQDGVRMRQNGRQDAVRMMGSLASGWRQVASGCVRMASGKHQNSVRMASGSVRLASGWRQGGVRILSIALQVVEHGVPEGGALVPCSLRCLSNELVIVITLLRDGESQGMYVPASRTMLVETVYQKKKDVNYFCMCCFSGCRKSWESHAKPSAKP